MSVFLSVGDGVRGSATIFVPADGGVDGSVPVNEADEEPIGSAVAGRGAGSGSMVAGGAEVADVSVPLDADGAGGAATLWTADLLLPSSSIVPTLRPFESTRGVWSLWPTKIGTQPLYLTGETTNASESQRGDVVDEVAS